MTHSTESRLSDCPGKEQPNGMVRSGCTVYVGDGVWDARACRGVGVRFIGIATGSRATRLFAEGAVRVFPDFSDADIFLRSVDEITNAA